MKTIIFVLLAGIFVVSAVDPDDAKTKKEAEGKFNFLK